MSILLQKIFQPLCIVVLDRHSQISNTYYHILAYAFSALCASMHCMIKMKCKTNYDIRFLSKVMRVESNTFGDPFIQKALQNQPVSLIIGVFGCFAHFAASKMSRILANKVVQKLKLLKTNFNKKSVPKPLFFIEKHSERFG